MTKITQEEAQRGLDELIRIAGLSEGTPVREPGWFDVYQVCDRLGVRDKNKLASKLNKLSDDGILRGKMVYDEDRKARIKVYQPVDPGNAEQWFDDPSDEKAYLDGDD